MTTEGAPDPTAQRRGDFPYRMAIPTRWHDNDMLGHVNNVIFYRYFEAVVVQFQMAEAGVDWFGGAFTPQAVETLCRFHRPLSFPETVDAGLRVARIGNSSVTFAIGLFGEGRDEPAATGHFVHVFVNSETMAPQPIPPAIREVYERFR